MNKIKFIDLFAGIGGTRIGFENACKKMGLSSECVFTSEIKPYAVKVYKNNFNESEISGDITKIQSNEIPDFDYLLAGFPCQPFSFAGSRKGFVDTRGTLFFEIERIIKEKSPKGFLLENVEGLISHDKKNKSDSIGNTLSVIIESLEKIGYKVTWQLINSGEYGIAQNRKRVYIVGRKDKKISLKNFSTGKKTLGEILEKNKPIINSEFTSKLLSTFSLDELKGKSIKDKRGGSNNIHSWDIGLKGDITLEQRELLMMLLKERRKKYWAIKKGITWMDGMPLTVEEISTFYNPINIFGSIDLEFILNDLVKKRYLKYEHPKDISISTDKYGNKITSRKYRKDLEKGYNIVTGKLSFEINKILHPDEVTPTLVATDVTRLAVIDNKGIRRLTIKEGLRLFGFPDKFKLDVSYEKAFDLLGNTVVVPIIEMITERLLSN